MQNRKKEFLILLCFLIFSNIAWTQENNYLSEEQMSLGKARVILLKSIVLPGWGEHSLGMHKRGIIFNTTDMLCWLGFTAFNLYGDQTKNDMKAYAITHAGINASGKNNAYFTDIGNYMNIYDYNENKLRYRQTGLVYDIDEYNWAWDSEESREKFDKQRLNAGIAKRNASFMIGALIVNRVLSIIDIISLTKGQVENVGSDFDTVFIPGREVSTLSINYTF